MHKLRLIIDFNFDCIWHLKNKQLANANVQINIDDMKIEEISKKTSQDTIYLIVETFSPALRRATTRNNIRPGFSEGRLLPLDLTLSLTSRYVMPTAISATRPNYISNKFLNS